MNHTEFDFAKRPGYLLWQTEHSLSQALHVALQPFELTLLQFNALATVANEPGISSAELARRNSVAPQSVQTSLRPLLDRGLVERRSHPVHGRVLGVYPLDGAAELVAEAGAAVDAVEERMLAGLSDAETELLRGFLLSTLTQLNPLALDRSSLRAR